MQGVIAFMRCSWVNRGSALTVHSVTCGVTWSCRVLSSISGVLQEWHFLGKISIESCIVQICPPLCHKVDHELEPLVIYIDVSNQAASKQSN
jgi:hypothetical protein